MPARLAIRGEDGGGGSGFDDSFSLFILYVEAKKGRDRGCRSGSRSSSGSGSSSDAADGNDSRIPAAHSAPVSRHQRKSHV